jgi:hypothetical protein
MQRTGVCLLLTLVACGSTAIATAPSSGTFVGIGAMTTARSLHTATLLPNGQVLIAGGEQGNSLGSAPAILASAELYDPDTGQFNSAGVMTTGRRLHTSTLLPDGRVFIAGGYGAGGPAGGTTAVGTAEIYDPTSGTFTPTGAMMTPRGGHTAILLSTGKVVMVGGYGVGSYPDLAPAELYDPALGTFTAAGPYVGRGGCDFCAPAVLLADGTVLFTGQSPAQIYDPVTNAFRATGMTMSDPSAAALLPSGNVLLAGGESLGRSASAELYDPTTGTFAATGSMAWRRVWHTLTVLPTGLALAAGGETDGCSGNACSFAGTVSTAELYDPSAGVFRATGNLVTARETHTATVLKDGRVLLAGGVSYGGIGIFYGALASAELYTPDALVPAPALVTLGNGSAQAAIFHAGTSDLVTPEDPAAMGEAIDILCTGLNGKSVIRPQVAIGGRLAQVLALIGDASNASGVRGVTVRVPSGIELGSAVPVGLTYLDRPSHAVTMAVRP